MTTTSSTTSSTTTCSAFQVSPAHRAIPMRSVVNNNHKQPWRSRSPIGSPPSSSTCSSTILHVSVPDTDDATSFTSSPEKEKEPLITNAEVNVNVNGSGATTTTTSEQAAAVVAAVAVVVAEPPVIVSTTPAFEAPQPYWCYWSTAYELTQAGIVGTFTGLLVAIFKLSIEAVRSLCYEQDILVPYPQLIALIPMLGGVMVGLLLLLGGPYPPGLRGTVQEVDEHPGHTKSRTDTTSSTLPSLKGIWQEVLQQGNFVRKSTAAVATLGTGCSLGPEGPCVEIGLNVARACTSFNRPVPSRDAGTAPILFSASQQDTLLAVAVEAQQQQQQQQSQQSDTSNSEPVQREWNRVLLSAGAAAGVAAGFNAPIAGVFFALEIMQNSFASIDRDRAATAATAAVLAQQSNIDNGNASSTSSTLPPPPSVILPSSITSTTSITPILIASVLSALISQSLLGNHLVLTLTQFDLETPLVELPLYLLLGALSGVVAFVFTYSAKLSQQFFAGDIGANPIRNTMKAIPDPVKPVIGGLLCGLVGLLFPQILFFGYETLNSLLKNNTLPLYLILTLMGVKTVMTAISAGSGLVGGTFAPSLFLGAMLGAAFHESATYVFETLLNFQVTESPAVDAITLGLSSIQAVPTLHIAGVPAYAMVGAASVLAALFRAPLTASLLLFEVTRNYDVILPLMASAGVGSIVGDILEDRLERRDQMQRRDRDPVSWGDLSDDLMPDDRDRSAPSSSSSLVDGVPTIMPSSSSSSASDTTFKDGTSAEQSILRRRSPPIIIRDEEKQ